MSYKVLARKWRPQHFRDMLGQEPVLRALVNALDTNRLHHAYMFTGMRGVGKTTIARIFAKCLNCETNGVSSNPCGECSACRDIEAGRFFDLIEVDAASRTKVEETRELLENVPYAPASGRYKVYLIDEVHMFSNHSFNALLKTLEEPPEHVKFLLATTDPQKVPVTVLSRCLQFNLKRMAPGNLADYLSKILDEESIEHERPALDLIARASEGSVRDSLSLVEQAAAFGEGAVRESDVETMLGRASVDRLLGLVESLGRGDVAQLFERVEQLAEYAPDFSELMGEILSLLHRIALLQMVPGSVSEDTAGFERLTQLATELADDEIQLYYQIGTHARRDMPFAPDPREAFDMALLRMNTFRPQGEPGQPSAPGSVPALAPVAAPVAPASTAARGSVSAGAALRDAALAAARGETVPTKPTPAAVEPAVRAPAAQTPPAQTARPPAAPMPAAQAPAAPTPTARAPASSASVDRSNIKIGDWRSIVAELDISGMPKQLASNCELVSVAGDAFNLRLESTSEHLHTPRFSERVQTALSEWLGRPAKLQISLVDDQLSTPSRIDEQVRADQMSAARDSIGQDPVVRQLIDRVDAAVDEASIAPLGED
ncbi:DNA polymerase III subunit gamma/tau [Granulosicoccus antarcticus]|uniref:DNA polymerase III subunit gamma/tau n=1 Tax=Granulosicoccus antarcticus IMCC3135 TaxID=1192854 RepID=A0A2Z2NSJ8_9GAMM|nr:DNA polymerase III subunit gamma/tau [Granulosicoccus antarcticus]ASJ74482.1 DNA polymerase III subunit tau [Granulosicoccus antarcticus IMCC3135]